MSLIRGAVSDAPFEKVYHYDQQFRLRISQNPTKSWSQIDGNLWLRFIAKGASGGQVTPAVSVQSLQKPCFDFNFKKGCFRSNCIFKHSCLKCNGMHPSVLCNSFKTSYNFNQHTVRKMAPRSGVQNQIRPMLPPRMNFRPPTLHTNSIRY